MKSIRKRCSIHKIHFITKKAKPTNNQYFENKQILKVPGIIELS